MLAPGARLGGVRIVEELGRGAMGIVYRAHDEGLGHEVAVKVLAAELTRDRTFVERFGREARLGMKVVHPNVARLHRTEQATGSAFLVMELVPGGSLAHLLKTRGRVPWPEAATIGAAIARGLSAVHEAGLVHRDIKPENVLLGAGGVPKLADFGLARRTRPSSHSIALTREGELVGTPAYAAPEQADGSEVGPPADLYALGATLYALVTGAPPFEGHGYELVKRHLLETPRPLSAIVPGLPEPLVELVARLLSKEPAARGRAAEVAEELDAIARERAVGRARWPLAAGGLVLLAAALWGTALALRRPPPRPPAKAEPDLGWTRSRVPDERLPKAIAALEEAEGSSRLPPWGAARLAELREKDALVRALAAVTSHEERRRLLADFVRRSPLHSDADWARARLAEETKALERLGWFEEPMPPRMRRGPERPRYFIEEPVKLELVWVPPGDFVALDEKQHLERGFYVGRTEVTRSAYLAFAKATRRPTPDTPAFLTQVDRPDDHPVVSVTWEDAGAFCEWVHGRLPTLLEWERVARGTDGRIYPWGNEWDAKTPRANTNDKSCPPDWTINGSDVPIGSRRDAHFDDGFPFTAPVGSFPAGASPEGALDLCGNVWEWCQDVHPEGGHYMRGGAWDSTWQESRSDYTNWHWMGSGETVGFRVLIEAP